MVYRNEINKYEWSFESSHYSVHSNVKTLVTSRKQTVCFQFCNWNTLKLKWINLMLRKKRNVTRIINVYVNFWRGMITDKIFCGMILYIIRLVSSMNDLFQIAGTEKALCLAIVNIRFLKWFYNYICDFI